MHRDDTIDQPKARAELAEWMNPQEFRRRICDFEKRVGPDKKFNDNKYKFLREAWVLAEVSKHKPFVKIRLAPSAEQWPDAFAQTENDAELKIEITSVQTPGRALGTEYRPDQESKEYDPIETPEKYAEALEDTIKKKVNDKNRGGALVVEVNIVNAIITPEEKERAILSVKGKYAPEFKHLWILWNGKVF
jgi:hypothetical protein